MKLAPPSRGGPGARASAARRVSPRPVPRSPATVQWEHEAARAAIAVATGAVDQAKTLTAAPAAAAPIAGSPGAPLPGGVRARLVTGDIVRAVEHANAVPQRATRLLVLIEIAARLHADAAAASPPPGPRSSP